MLRKKKDVSYDISLEDIDGFCEEIEQGKSKGRKADSHCRVEDALEIIPIEEGFELTLRILFSLSMLNIRACYCLMLT